ncbi:MAG: type II secretion system protein [Pseudomonadota bacterium]
MLNTWKKNLNRVNGFTMIELIMVIVILGILSAFALPRFANLTNDARRAAMEGIMASVKSTIGISHSMYLVRSSNDALNQNIDLEGITYTLVEGYPSAADICEMARIEVVANGGPFECTAPAGTPLSTTISYGSTNCSFDYNQAANSMTPPVVSPLTLGSDCS